MLGAAVTAVAICALLPGWAAYRLTRRIAPAAPEPVRNAPPNTESLRLTAADGVELGAWFIAARAMSTCGVLVVHGNGSRRSDQHRIIDLIRALNCHVLAVTVRAHGDSEGQVNDFGYSARLDLIAAFNALRKKAPEARIYIVGRSLGAAAALFAAESLKSQPAGYVLESPYADLRTATTNRLEMMLPGALVAPAYWALDMWATLFLPVSVEQISPERAAVHVPSSVPVLLLLGSADRHATLDEANRIQNALAGGAERVVFEGASHAQLLVADPRRYAAALRNFVDTTEKR